MDETKEPPDLISEEERKAWALNQQGIKACYICGLPAVECDQKADDLGFDECEWLAEK